MNPTTLHDRLEESVADVAADLPALTSVSRQQGMALRRRRRVLATVGTAAAATVLAAALWAALPGGGGSGDTIATEPPTPPLVTGPLSGHTAASTDGGMAVALTTAVHQVAPGTFSHVQGDAYDHESFAALVLEPATGPAGQVMINVQPLHDSVGGPPYSCSESYMTDCAVRRLPGGDVLRTYREDDDTEIGPGSQRQVVELLSPDRDLRIVVNALNTTPWTGGAMRDEPVLTLGQETEIATLPWWDATTLPVEFVDAGR